MTENGEPKECPDPDLAPVWRYIDVRCSGLAPKARDVVRNAIANSVLDGHLPSATSIDDLVDFASGRITSEQHQERVLARARAQGWLGRG